MIPILARRMPVVLALLAALALTPAAQADDRPFELINETASELQVRLEGKQDYYSKNQAELYEVIDEILLPGFDVEYAGKLVLGKKHWQGASEEQRQRFLDAFYGFLVKTYAKGLLSFDQRNMTVDPQAVYSADKRKALVRTRLSLEAGEKLEVNYALREKSGDWKIYDVRIDGVSYIQNYRNQFDAEISAQGIDTVIQRLEKESGAMGPQIAETTAAPEAA